MLCPSCSANIPDGSAFCPMCGQSLTAGAPQPAAPPATGPTAAQRVQAAKGTANDEPEQELWRGTYSPKAMVGRWLLAAVATVAAFALSAVVPNPITWIAAVALVVVLWLVLGCYLLIQRFSVEYTLTTQRFIHNSGLLRRVTNRVEVIDVDDVTFEQGPLERMLGVGTIKLLSSDISDPKLTLPGIDDVQRVATLIDNARREQRKKRGLYIETV
jgi:membrane protein YdbS with pleckstrin-like domain